MVSDLELERAKAVLDRARLISDIEDINPIIKDILNSITIDVEFLCDRLWAAWATVEAYQKELRETYQNDND
jgi:hypothetical protein